MSMKKKNLGAAAQAATQRLFTGAQAEAERQEDTRKPLNDTEKAVLEKYNAVSCAKLVMEAAEIYEKRGILL